MKKNNLFEKGIVLGIIVLLLTISVLPSTGTSVIEKSSTTTFDGNTLYVGGHGPENYSKIQDAVDNASDGDTVFVYDDSSPYYENLLVGKSISLIGENKETTIIDGGFDFQVIWVVANSVIINGFTLRNADIGLYGNTNHSSVSDNIFSCYQAGLGLLYSSNNQISDNLVVSGYELGIALLHSSDKNVVSDNIVQNTYVGIYLAGSCMFNKISGNTIKQCSEYGIWIYWSFLNFVNKNNFMDNGCSAYFENSSFNLWLRNYWDDWPSSSPRPINGTRYGPLLKTTDPWKTYDWRPAQEPYDIPTRGGR